MVRVILLTFFFFPLPYWDYCSGHAVCGSHQTFYPAAKHVLLKAETERNFLLLFLPSFPLIIYCLVINSIISVLQCTVLSFWDYFSLIVNEIAPQPHIFHGYAVVSDFKWHILNRFSFADGKVNKIHAVFIFPIHAR